MRFLGYGSHLQILKKGIYFIILLTFLFLLFPLGFTLTVRQTLILLGGFALDGRGAIVRPTARNQCKLILSFLLRLTLLCIPFRLLLLIAIQDFLYLSLNISYILQGKLSPLPHNTKPNKIYPSHIRQPTPPHHFHPQYINESPREMLLCPGHNFIMYNSFICERRARKERQIMQQRQKEAHWLIRYHTEVQPVLLDHYGKRINSFIHNVTTNPIHLGPQPMNTLQPKGKSLVFKNGEDWKSLKGPCERNLGTEPSLSNSSLKASTKQEVRFYTPLRKVFRERSKQKQIHPPMRYNNKLNIELAQIRKRQLHKLRPPITRERKMSEVDPLFRPPTNLHSTNNSLSRYEDEEQFSRGNQIENIEVEARLYEKQRQIVEKKLHFKKLLDLSVNNPDPQNRKEYKTILERCGIYRNKMREQKAESGEFDRFASLVQRGERPK